MSLLKTPFALFLLSASFLLNLSAQELNPVECRFLAVTERPDTVVNLVGGGKDITVKMVKNSISAPLECFTVDGVLKFVDVNGKPLASTPIPKKIKKTFIVFFKVPNKDLWKIIPFEDSPEEFPKGGAHVINLHADQIRFVIGKTKEVLPSLSSKGVPMPTDLTEFNMAPVVFQFKNKQDKWINGKETAYRFLPDIRYLLIAYIDPDNGRPRVKTFRDSYNPPPPAS